MSMKFKRGDLFEMSGTVDLRVNGALVADLTGWSAQCQIRTLEGLLVASPTVELVSGPARVIRVFVPRQDGTAHWPTETLETEILFVSPSGDPVRTPTATIEVEEGVVRDS